MADAWVAPAWRRWFGGVLAGAVLVAAASGVVALLEASMQQLVGRPLVYLLAVLLVATWWGTGPGVVTAVASVVTFTYLFVPPRASFLVQDLTLGVSLGIFLAVGVIVAWQAAHLRRNERESARLSREQAGLRRVATLVAAAARPREVFAAVDDEVARLLEPDLTTLVRFEPDGSATFLAGGGWRGRAMRLGHPLPVPLSLGPLRDRSVVRLDDLRQRPDMSEAVEKQGVVAVVACPVVVEGRVWGAFGVGSRGEPFPATTERRLVDFTELIGTAIANAESRTEITRLLDEQGALRRVATVVARGVPPERVFAMVTDEISRLLDANVAVLFRLESDGGTTVVARTGQADEMLVGSRWEFDPHMASAEALRTGRPARRDDYSAVEGPFAGIIQRLRPRSSVAIPVLVAGRIWGVLTVAATRERFPADTEQRIAGFADLVGTAIANTESRAQVDRLLEVQAALHRVATLVAREATPDEVVPVVTEEIRRTLDADATLVARLDPDGRCTIVDQHGPHPAELRVGRRWTPATGLAIAEALQTGQPAVREGYSAQSLGEVAAQIIHTMGINHAIALPIVVDGKVWGAVGVARTRAEPFPPDVAQRVPGFAELLATSLRNTENRTQTRRLLDEQAALRRVAMVVARGGSEQEVFGAAADEIATVVEGDVVMLYRFTADALTATLMGLSGWPDGPMGASLRTNPDAVETFRRGAPVRLDDVSVMREATVALDGSGMSACVVVPVILGDRLWGVVLAGSRSGPLPDGSEERLAGFAELVGTAIANTESRAEIVRLLDEQGSLRRVATVVARGASEQEVFGAAAEEVAKLLGADMAALYRFDGDPVETVTAMSLSGWADGPLGRPFAMNAAASEAFRRGEPVRVDDVRQMPEADAALSGSGVRSIVAHAVVVEGRPWGAFMIGSRSGPLPAEPQRRLASFAELIGTAIANTQSRAEIVRLLDEQSALRRVATVVARDAPAEEVFRAAADEVIGLLGVDVAVLYRFEGEAGETATLMGASGWDGARPGSSIRTDRPLVDVLWAGDTLRLDDIAAAPAAVAALVGSGIRSVVATAIVIEGRPWGVFGAGARGGPLPPGTEQRLASFAELVATAIANTQSKGEITSLLEHQAALRRVATLVAREAPPDEVMPAVADEIGRVFGADAMHMLRLEPDGGATIVAQKGDHPPGMGVGNRYVLDPGLAMTEALRTGRPARRDRYEGLGQQYTEVIGRMRLRSGVAIPILVHGHVWGSLGIAASRGPFPPDTERRLASFTELIAMAIGNAESRAQVLRLLAEQGALERVATLVAGGPTPAAVSRAVAEEIRVLLGVSDAGVCRFESDGASVLLAGVGEHIGPWPVGIRWPLDEVDSSSEVWHTGRPARLDGDRWMRARGRVAERLRQIGVRSVVACPVTVDGRLWGAVMSWSQETSLPADSEQRMARFTDLVAMAIGNAEHQAELAASRARIVAASDEARRRIERDLHDGAQQRIVSLGLELRLVQAGVPDELPEVRDGLGRIVEELGQLLDELRETARGIHPAMLAEGGLESALRTLARRAPVPVELDLRTKARFPEQVEVATYYVVSEALTNAAKHAAASHVAVSLGERAGMLRLSVSDDGVGGADPQRGSGLIGLRDRVEALGGTIEVESRKGTGTRVVVCLPIANDGTEPLTASPDR